MGGPVPGSRALIGAWFVHNRRDVLDMQTPIRDLPEEKPSLTPEPPEISAGSFDPEIASGGFVFEPLLRWALETPDKIAIVSEEGAITYAQFERRTNQIARALRQRGVKRGDLVALVLPRGAQTIQTIVGVLKSGAAYVPIDSETPAERIRHCIEDSNPSLIVVQDAGILEEEEAAQKAVDTARLFTDADAEGADQLPTAEIGLSGADLAYVIFTSGTTGRPKGVPITHAALTNFVLGDQKACIRVAQDDRVFQGFSPASDGHHEEVWPAFLAGASLVVATTHDIHSGHELGGFLERNGVTIISCAPTLLSMIEDDVPSLRRILFGAERCPAELVRRWWRPDREIVNTYGPTEATVGATFGYCVPDQPITIGKPLPNYYCYILDPEGNPVPRGSEGELCIAGIGVSSGYLGRPDLSASKFVPNLVGCAAHHNETAYRTGDRVRLADDGNIEWLGRIDDQVKIRGHRIELSEIETHLLASSAVQSAVAVAREAGDQDMRLTALIVLRSGVDFDLSELHERLHAELPAYMVPQSLERVDHIPMLPSGKVDRRACEKLHGVTIRIEREILPPKTETERIVLGVWQQMFPDSEISCADDFFRDLGGYSLLASRFISVMRSEHGYPSVSVLDIYQNPTIRSFAAVLQAHARPTHAAAHYQEVPRRRYLVARFVQMVGILILFGLQGAFWLGPLVAAIYFSTDLGVSDSSSLLLGLALHAGSVPFMLAFTLGVKWAIVGRFKPGRYPVWGTAFLRWWFVHRLLGITPVGFLTGTPLASIYLRMLGAKVGKNVNFESVEIDCPDMIQVGDDCSFENSSWIHASEVTRGELIIRPIVVGNGCSVGVRAGLSGGSVLEDGVSLRDMTCATAGLTIPKGEEWAGSPARKCESSIMPPYDPAQQPTKKRLVKYSIIQTLAVMALTVLDSIPFMTAAWMMYNLAEQPQDYLYWEPVFASALVVFACVQGLAVKWAVIGRLKPGTYKFPGGYYIRKWFAERHLEAMSGTIVPIYDSLFARPWCRALGMKCGPRCEIALPRRMPYDLVEMGEESFLASEVSIGRPIRRNGKVMLEPTIIGKRSFLGNDSVVPQGIDVPDEFLLGVLSTCPQNAEIGDEPNQAWLGSPAFRMPTRQIHDQFDVRQTYRPTNKLYAERLLHESIRIFLPSLCSLIVAMCVIEGFVEVWNDTSLLIAVLCSPLIYCVGTFIGAALCKLAKFLLIGKYKPTVQPLWSRFVWKTETYSAILHDFAAPLFISDMSGTPFLSSVMRFLGAKVGKRCFINTTDFTETDLIQIGDDVAINANAPLQAHLFEDRVIKVGPIKIGDRCTVGNYSVILCESELKNDAHVEHLSLVMKGETIPAGTTWAGSPAQALPDADDETRCLNGKP